jgi:Mg-chelatase subunit ChlD
MITDPIARKKALIDAARLKGIAKPEDAAIQRTVSFVEPKDAKNRIRIVFDNSGSMSTTLAITNGFSSRMAEAKKGVIEFLRNSSPNRDAVAIHMLNSYSRYRYEEEHSVIPELIENAELCTDLIRLASAVDNPELTPIGGTPLFETLETALEAEPRATRLVAFSDGEANSTIKMGVVISLAKRYQIPIDTVFFGSYTSATLKELAESTGGIFITFDPAKGVSFASSFKYLTEGNRLRLMNAEFKAKLERGEIK